MSLRNFRSLFTLLFSLLLCGFGIYLGLQVPKMPQIGPVPSGDYLIQHISHFDVEVTIALALLGLLVGIWIGPRVADKIIQAGKSLERMSATDKIAVGIGTALGVIVTLFFFQLLSQIPIPLPVRIGIFILLSVILIYLGIVAMMS